MNITLSSVVIDAAEPEPESAFWHRLLGGSLTRTPTNHFIQAPGVPVLVIQSAPEQTAPVWPDGNSQQMHLDFAVDDLAAADRLAVESGAGRLRPTDDVRPEPEEGSRIYTSPAGHPFCLRPAG
ncbi:VOC family protein [Streptomyces armeniacus]|uniref:VOC family protein n=1 Tax=Streptomyces armeniacus TaxID=83291 RepID=A0A345XPH1_9ACTN|nr:VOC family protein [Streptomyces armeniacus]AXK33537.1 VOC family protein [Streptomyces armeniacus]